jgi:two-component system phosphate regulon response regulator PhoB
LGDGRSKWQWPRGRDVYVEPRTVDVHIRRLRKAINADVRADLIRTVRTAGCTLDLTE